MRRIMGVACVWAGMAAVSAVPLLAQSRIGNYPISPTGTTGTTNSPNGRGGRGSCAQQAGISRSVMQQRREIVQSARSQEEGVCSNSSLSMQQKRAEIRQIRQQAREQADALVTPEQMQSVEACRGGRGGNRGGRSGARQGGGGGGGGGGICGEMPSGSNTGTRGGRSLNEEPIEPPVEE